jgi:hypothetical protein
MRIDYPELSGYTELEPLTAREMMFCWLVGSRTSPIIKYEKLKRVRAAVAQAYPRASRKKKEVVAMMDGNIPSRLIAGVQRMASFRPSVRLRAKLMDEYIFNTLQELIVVGEEDKLAMDTDEKKKYADFVLKVSTEMPDMIKRMESGFGIKTAKEDEDVTIKASITDVRDRLNED